MRDTWPMVVETFDTFLIFWMWVGSALLVCYWGGLLFQFLHRRYSDYRNGERDRLIRRNQLDELDLRVSRLEHKP